MFLAHFSGDGVSEVLKWDAKDIYYWYHEAVKVHDQLNKSEEE